MERTKNLIILVMFMLTGVWILSGCQKDEFKPQEDNSLPAIAKRWYMEQRSKNGRDADLGLNKLSIDWSKGSIGYNAYGDSVLFVPMHNNEVGNTCYYELNVVRNGQGELLGAVKEYHGDPFGTEELFLHFYSGSGTLLQVALHNPLEGTMRKVSDILRDKVARSIEDKIAQQRSNSNGSIVIEEITVTGYQEPKFLSIDMPHHHELEIPSGGGGAGGRGSGNSATAIVVLAPTISIDLKKRLDCLKKVPDNANTKYSITLHVDKTTNFGHAFITLEKSNGDNMQRLSYGFYPETESRFRTITSSVVPTTSSIGEEAGDSERVSDIRYTLNLNHTGASTFQKVINKSLSNESKMYDLNSYNCTDYAIDVFNEALSSNKIDAGSCYRPSELYNILKNRKGSGNNNINDTKINKNQLPKSTNCQ